MPSSDDCVETKEKEFELTVLDDATVDPDCLVVRTGKTTLTWKADPAKVESLKVKFDPSDRDNPGNPVCAGTTCTLDKAKQSMKGVFEYLVYVVRKDGTTAGKDPVLIIRP